MSLGTCFGNEEVGGEDEISGQEMDAVTNPRYISRKTGLSRLATPPRLNNPTQEGSLSPDHRARAETFMIIQR